MWVKQVAYHQKCKHIYLNYILREIYDILSEDALNCPVILLKM